MEEEDFLGLTQSIYEEMKALRGDDEALQQCVQDSVAALLNQTPDPGEMAKPICLLGKIQSGKTRAFIGVMAKAFDEGVNTIIVLTKNSKILGEQTTKRIANEFHALESGRSISVDYITEVDEQVILGEAQVRQKRVIVGIKHYLNIQKIIQHVIVNNSGIAAQKVLIIDDEADVSAIGYRRVVENVPFDTLPEEEQQEIIAGLAGRDAPVAVQKERKELLLVAEKINQLRLGMPDHSYFQVTATPASIFLQPETIVIQQYNDDYTVEDSPKAPLLSDKTIILPIHADYIGGEYFFGQASAPDSMAQYAYRNVSSDELKFLGKRDQRHINNIFRSSNFPTLTEFVDNIVLAVASYTACIVMADDRYTDLFRQDPIRLLNAVKSKLGGFSAMIHTSTQIEIHKYQTELVESYLSTCRNVVENNPENLKDRIKAKLEHYFTHSILPSFELFKDHPAYRQSQLKNLDRVTFDFIFECYCQVLRADHVRVFKINSDAQIEARIDPGSGELKREVLANIYIGGQSLDRGITLQRLLGFFYGREPKIAQLDTTLQHARLYGARPAQDLLFTRFYSSDTVHQRLSEITEIDEILRQSIINNDGDNRFATIELGANGTVRPTNPNRIMISDCINLKSHKRFLPISFNTREGNACERHMQTLDRIIAAQLTPIPGYEGQEAFFITWEVFKDLYTAFMNGMVDPERWDEKPIDRHWDLKRLETFYSIIKGSYFRDDDRLILLVKRNRNQKRIKIDGKFQDTPETSQSDSRQMKEIMLEHNVPGLFLFEQAGDVVVENGIDYGWKGQRFYWPLLMLPTLQRNIMISLDAINKGRTLEPAD